MGPGGKVRRYLTRVSRFAFGDERPGIHKGTLAPGVRVSRTAVSDAIIALIG